MAPTPKKSKLHNPMEWTKFAVTIVLIPVVIIVLLTPRFVEASIEYSALGIPTCNPPGIFRPGRKLDFGASKKNGAIVDSKGSSFILTGQLEDCANWCCKLPAVNCSIATLEIKSTGANCHLLTCYPSELCIFNPRTEFVSYDRTLFVPKDAYKVKETNTSEVSDGFSKSGGNGPILSFVDQQMPPSQNIDPQRDSMIKPRKGVGLPPPPTDKHLNQTTISNREHPNMPMSEKRKTPVGTIFLYSALILALLAMFAFFGQKFLDCWERRHYTRADYLLDGMYEDNRHGLKAHHSPCH
ncbi:uncharacterized protein LOC111248024 [Varroa destructor]|uniref:MANSC domain-containing protein n=1 Tax=Varroa destructor TaxID=109461 RepID=A0A7M7K060_VARDE|nr:uncharacterized protein LOC111248024 [Varroa destructor]XP_022655448.1 uncharacterized protein LOC111248024 [Varroa destructor]